jgi:formate-dependent nitrite reductase membrane component NrfD
MGYYIPIIAIFKYLKSFGPSGVKNGLNESLFGFWMAFYHATWIGVPVGLLLSLIINK